MTRPSRLGGQVGTDEFLVVVGVDATVDEGRVGPADAAAQIDYSSVGSINLARLISSKPFGER